MSSGRWPYTKVPASSQSRRRIAIPAARNFRFAPDGDRLLVSPLGSRVRRCRRSTGEGSYRNVGRTATWTWLIPWSRPDGGRARTATVEGRLAVRRVRTGDGLTTDGENDAAAISPNGELLLARAGSGATENIWSRSLRWDAPEGDERAIRHLAGLQPRRQAAGSYVDYRNEEHHDLRDGNRTNVGSFGAMRCSRRGRASRPTARRSPTSRQTAPSHDDGVLDIGREGVAAGRHALAVSAGLVVAGQRLDVRRICRRLRLGREGASTTGLRTGRRIQVTDNQSAVNDELECWPKNGRRDVAIFPQAAGGDGGDIVSPPSST